LIEITKEDFSVEAVVARLRTGGMGAVVTFIGTVRNESRGRTVDSIEIQVFPEMARAQLEAIRAEALQKFGVRDIAVVHRYGSLKVSENIMMIAVGAGHRGDAFDACRYVIDNIKARVPIWKKEITSEGDFWVEGEGVE